MSDFPFEVRHVARTLVMTLMQRTVHAGLQPHRTMPVRGYLVAGVTPERYVNMGKRSQEYSLYTTTCEYVAEHWLRASAIPGKRFFQLRHTPMGVFLDVAEHYSTAAEAESAARLRGQKYMWNVAENRHVPLDQ